MKDHFIAVDCGTSLVKTAVFDKTGTMKGLNREKMDPCSDIFVEFDAKKLLSKVITSLRKTISKSRIASSRVASLTITGQRATFIAVDERGDPISKAISWQDMRASDDIKMMGKRISRKDNYEITGLPFAPAFTASKIHWLKRNNPALFKKTHKFMLVSGFLMNKMGCDDFLEDVSNASLTGLMDVKKGKWSPRMLKVSGTPEDKLPAIVESGVITGRVSRKIARQIGLQGDILIVSGGGDQQCAAIGSGAVKPGQIEINLGTAGVVMACLSEPAIFPGLGLMCCRHAIPGRWEIEALQYASGSSVQWASRIMNNGKRFDIGRLNKELSFSKKNTPGDILFFPYLIGAGAPIWNDMARGCFLGISQHHGTGDLLRAVFEGICFENNRNIQVIADVGIKIKDIKVTGGLTKGNDFLNQMKADIYGHKVFTTRIKEETLLGAAILGSVGAGMYGTVGKAASRMIHEGKVFSPDPDINKKYRSKFNDYEEIYANRGKGIFNREYKWED